MKYRPHGKYGKKDRNAFSLFLIISGILISYFMGGFYFVWHIPFEATMTYDIDTSRFIAPNFARLQKMAKTFNYYFDTDNSPLDYTLTVDWKDIKYKQIDHYGTTGDAAIWSGMNLAAQSYHYAVAKESGDPDEIRYALNLVEKTLRGVSLLIAVPSGGIGESYPALLARAVCPKAWEKRGNPPLDGFGEGQRDPNDIFDGVGPYSDYWWKGYPSTDQWSGIILGLGQCARIFMNETGQETAWIRTRVHDLAIQIVESYRKSNWMILDQTPSGNSRTTGQDFKISVEMVGSWTLSILKMGMVAVPDRYTKLYYHYALERNYINYMETDYRIFNLFNYYSLNINFNVLTNLVSLEEDPSLRIRYENIVNKIYYPIIRTSRNAWFNLAYLLMMHVDSMGKLDDDRKEIRLDVLDQLMRFDVPRAPNGTTRVPERGGDRNPVPYTYSDPTEKYRANLILNFLYGWIFDMYSKKVYSHPKTTDEYHEEDFLWQRTPWEPSGKSSATRQDSGLAFLLPYYIGRYLNLFPGTI